VNADDPRADPVVVDLIELAGLWVAAGDWQALERTLDRLDEQLTQRFAADPDFARRFRELKRLASGGGSPEEIRRTYRRAAVG
jgi:hypothetical protein